MPGIGSSATSVLIGHIAGATQKIRVGSGGIMLPNHAPLVIAEQFGTLESIYPEESTSDLGVRQARTKQRLMHCAVLCKAAGMISRNNWLSYRLILNRNVIARVRAFPGEGLDIPIWLLGSSGFSAQLAARKGYHFPLPVILHLPILCMHCNCIIKSLSHRRYFRNHMPCLVSMSSQRRRMKKQCGWQLLNNSNSLV